MTLLIHLRSEGSDEIFFARKASDPPDPPYSTEATDDRISRSLPVDYMDASQATRSNHHEWFEVKVLHQRSSYRTGHEKSETLNKFDMNSTQLNFRKLFYIISGRCIFSLFNWIKR